MKTFAFLILVLITVAFAADRVYVKGILVNVTVGKRTVGVPANGGTLIAQKNVFEVDVKVDGVIYTGETRSGEIRNLIVGDPVETRMDDKTIYLRCQDGKEIKAKLLTKRRVPAQ